MPSPDAVALAIHGLRELRAMNTVVVGLEEDHPQVVAIDAAIAEFDAGKTTGGGVEMPTRELLPCPHCNGDADISTWCSEDADWYVYCKSCLSSSGFFDEEDDAIAAWNKRAWESAPVEKWQPVEHQFTHDTIHDGHLYRLSILKGWLWLQVFDGPEIGIDLEGKIALCRLANEGGQS